MKLWLGVATLAAGVLISEAATASTFFPEEVVCVVGGEKFTHRAYMSYSTWGRRPDGKPYGSAVFPILPPECPGNGLFMYRKFSKAELTRLKGLLASADYQAQRANETPFARIAWLETALNPDSEDLPGIWLQASWEADEAPRQKETYQRAFIAAAKVRLSKMKEPETRWLILRMMNAYRELGEFDAALALYETLNPEALMKGLPDNAKAVDALDEDKQARWYTARMANMLRTAILRQDRSAEPLDLIPERVAAELCFFEPETVGDFGRTYCDLPAIKTVIEENRESWAGIKVEMAAAPREK
ncbi:hypothetical protein [Asticcacaulis sp.]|uniref:hypothetical protein n=1 Tax=Asticcacaulis sp. TaxID=1872648 RepID=UPI00391D1043